MRWGNETIRWVCWKLWFRACQIQRARGPCTQKMLMSHWLSIAFILTHRPLGAYMALHLGCDLWPNGDLSINYDINNSEAGCVISLFLQRVGEMFCFPEPWKFSRHEIVYRSGFGRQAVFRDSSDGISKSSFPSVSSLLAMDDWKTSLSPSGTVSFIPDTRIQCGSGQCVADLVFTFIFCSKRRSGQWRQEDQRSGWSHDGWIFPSLVKSLINIHESQKFHGYGE